MCHICELSGDVQNNTRTPNADVTVHGDAHIARRVRYSSALTTQQKKNRYCCVCARVMCIRRAAFLQSTQTQYR